MAHATRRRLATGPRSKIAIVPPEACVQELRSKPCGRLDRHPLSWLDTIATNAHSFWKRRKRQANWIIPLRPERVAIHHEAHAAEALGREQPVQQGDGQL